MILENLQNFVLKNLSLLSDSGSDKSSSGICSRYDFIAGFPNTISGLSLAQWRRSLIEIALAIGEDFLLPSAFALSSISSPAS